MRKINILILLLITLLSLSTLVGCKDENTLVVGATSAPHAEILEFAKPLFEEKGYKLQIEVFEDYTLLNPALQSGNLDVNYFQHTPYLNSFNSKKGTNLVSVAKIHYEPFGLYGKGISDLNNVPSGTTIFVPNDDSNLTRALLLLQQEGLVELDSNKNAMTGIDVNDITNSNGYNIQPVAADLVPAQFKNNDNILAVINGNYAIASKISISTALAIESADGDAASTYGNILAVKSGNENDPKVLALIEILSSQVVKDYITSTYNGAVLPL